MVNRWIAWIFERAITLLHVMVIGLLGWTAYALLSQQEELSILFMQLGIPWESYSNYVLFIVVGLFFAYVVIMGALSTLIAINNNLRRIYTALTDGAYPRTVTTLKQPDTLGIRIGED